MSWAYERAAQDLVTVDMEVNVPDDAIMALGEPDTETLPYLLAQYHAVAEPLWRDLGKLRDPGSLAGDPAASAAVLGALGVFADIVERIGSAWAAWSPPGGAARIAWASGATPRSRPLPPPEGSFAERTVATEVSGLDALHTQNIRGRVAVVRNAGLLPGRATAPAFIYRVPPVSAASKVWPLLDHRATLRLPPTTPDALPGRLAELFARFLDVTPDSPDEEGRPLRVAVSWLYPMVPGGAPGTAPSPPMVEVPVTLSPTATFIPSRDLAAPEGLCARLGARLALWAQERSEAGAPGEFRLDLAAYANLSRGPGAGDASPLVAIHDLRMPVARISGEARGLFSP